jgi:hypothetical protein
MVSLLTHDLMHQQELGQCQMNVSVLGDSENIILQSEEGTAVSLQIGDGG